MTTEKQEATRIVNKFKGFEMPNEKIASKQCGTILVDEILNFLSIQIGFYDSNAIKHFRKVKKEIEFL